MVINSLVLKEILSFWGVHLKRICHEFVIPGSPERIEFRVVIESREGMLFLLEKVSDKQAQHKKDIIRTLDILDQNGIKKVNTYLKSLKGEQLISFKGDFWQLSRFIEGTLLNRPQYVYEEWRGKVLAEFLINVKRKAGDVQFFNKNTPFSLTEYIYSLFEVIKQRKKDLASKFSSVITFLEKEFMDIYPDFPISFCHGDFHPVNVIWSPNGIRSVIDWEFLGYKPEIYDIANLIGCVGIEDPRSLTRGLTKEFLRTILDSGMVSNFSLSYLPEFIIALRFGWLSEWLRKKDVEMIEMEEVYMKLFIKNRDVLKEEWGILAPVK